MRVKNAWIAMGTEKLPAPSPNQGLPEDKTVAKHLYQYAPTCLVRYLDKYYQTCYA